MWQKREVFIRIGMLAMVLILTACNAVGQNNPADLPQVPNSEENEDIDELRRNVAQVAGNLPADFPVMMYQGEGYQDGDEVMFSDLLVQGKPVVLNFWAGLCPPCRLEMPDFQMVSNEYRDRVLLFGLDVGPFTGLGSNDDGRALLQELAITYPAGTTSDQNVVREYELLGMPATYFITPDGILHETWTGLLTAEKLTELIENLLAVSVSS